MLLDSDCARSLSKCRINNPRAIIPTRTPLRRPVMSLPIMKQAVTPSKFSHPGWGFFRKHRHNPSFPAIIAATVGLVCRWISPINRRFSSLRCGIQLFDPDTGSIFCIDRSRGGYSTNFGKTRKSRLSPARRSRQLAVGAGFGKIHRKPKKISGNRRGVRIIPASGSYTYCMKKFAPSCAYGILIVIMTLGFGRS